MLAGLKREERIGLGIAAGLHAALVLAFLLQPETRDAIEPTQRMTVNLASEVGLEATAPDPVVESRAAIAPVLADEPVAAVEETPVRSLPVQTAQTRQPAPARPDQREAKTPPKPAKTGGGTLVGKDFLAGMGGSASTSETRTPAAALGAGAKASLLQAIVREIKPRWQPPSGAEADQLVSRVRFRLNPDGSLAGRPEVLGQRGISDANRAQAARHGEQAVRAVQLAAPFALPAEYYAAWKTVTLEFDWKLSQ